MDPRRNYKGNDKVLEAQYITTVRNASRAVFRAKYIAVHSYI